MLRAAVGFQRSGDAAQSISAYQRLLARWPAHADDWYNLAYQLRQAGRFQDALAAYQQALDRGVSRPEEVRMNRSVIFCDNLRDDVAAERELREALALRPDFVPAFFNLANLEEARGNRSEARALYDQVLALDPHHYEALARRANTQTFWKPDDPLLARLRQAAAQPNMSTTERASIGFALGSALDAIGAYDRAFAAYTMANGQSRLSSGSRVPLYDRQQHERFVDELIEVFARKPAAPSASDASNPPIFICGMFRSGSTLTERILASHPRVTPAGELGLLPAMVRTDLAPFPASLKTAAPTRLAELAARYRQQVAALFPGADVITDKRPDNFLYIGLIKALFPTAKFVHTTRQPLDNCLSIYFLHLDHGMGYALDLMDTGHYYRQYRRLMDHWKTLYAADILDFDYDAHVREPRRWTEKLLDFCGLDWDEACLSFQDANAEVRTASAWQVREPLYSRASGRWRNYETQLAPLKTYLADLLDDGPPA
jgi:tetratricopeptide (TPR) repeat protein